MPSPLFAAPLLVGLGPGVGLARSTAIRKQGLAEPFAGMNRPIDFDIKMDKWRTEMKRSADALKALKKQGL